MQVKKIKIKKLNNNIDLDTTNRRLAVLGPAGERDLEVKLAGNIEFTAFPRAFFSDTWGGGRLATGPAIGERKMREHNFRNFLYPTTDYCPASTYQNYVRPYSYSIEGCAYDCRSGGAHVFAKWG